MQEPSNNNCLWEGEHRAWVPALGGSLTFMCVFLHYLTFNHVYMILFRITFVMSQILPVKRSGHRRLTDNPYKVFLLAFAVIQAPEFSSWEFTTSEELAFRGSHLQTEWQRLSTLTHTLPKVRAGLWIRSGNKTRHFTDPQVTMAIWFS